MIKKLLISVAIVCVISVMAVAPASALKKKGQYELDKTEESVASLVSKGGQVVGTTTLRYMDERSAGKKDFHIVYEEVILIQLKKDGLYRCSRSIYLPKTNGWDDPDGQLLQNIYCMKYIEPKKYE